MPSVNDIVNVAEALEKSPVAVFQDRCVVVRNRNSSCRRCVRACAFDAIEVAGNEVVLDASRCVACGACTAACPTEALAFLDPADTALVAAAKAALEGNGSRAVIACARAASKRTADPAAYAEVPCLPRVDESLVLELAAAGAEEVLLVDGGCPTCKYRDCVKRVDELVGSTRGLISAHGGSCAVERRTGFPDDMLVESAQGLFGTTRRGFFSEAASAARDTAMTAARATIAQELGYDKGRPDIGERLRVTQEGTLPLLRTPRHEAAINALDVLGAPAVDVIDSRLFGSVEVDVGKCNACGMCAVFCPTGALKRDPADRPNAPLRYLEFSASGCVQCGVCADVCWKGALTLDPRVGASQLYDFEPVAFDLSGAKPQRNALFGKSPSK